MEETLHAINRVAFVPHTKAWQLQDLYLSTGPERFNFPCVCALRKTGCVFYVPYGTTMLFGRTTRGMIVPTPCFNSAATTKPCSPGLFGQWRHQPTNAIGVTPLRHEMIKKYHNTCNAACMHDWAGSIVWRDASQPSCGSPSTLRGSSCLNT